ncbi:DNA mismatch repair domain protein [Prevotella sp. oral taxon 472 str. F0295]|nr:DNA mismatch repair endonuclease MutL [Prevotella sp. oral taxon 472]EEX54375.1 DNA mismatch repair domain protein [Prevotella sp. oral taxon 472 str. F0295]
MSDVIQLLPDSVANQIAAGEVIQRPASIIKELVENAVDAGATRIDVNVIDAGKTSVQVIDNGRGMSETDARLAFERHATSKIRQASDLFALSTMGFRGEALASIAAVAQVELKTRLASEEIGTSLSIAGSQFTGQEPCACPVGSNFVIENLFYNIPARRKFLKSNATELNNIITAFERIALVYPDIAFTLRSNGTEVFNLPSVVLKQRIVDVFGKRISQDLLSFNVETSICKIHGFVGKPESARKKGAHQYFFVNGRYMKHPYFSKAVMLPFERLIPQGEQVPYFIYFEVNPEDIDVNIHPTKTEIKFENEQAVWQILSVSVREAVGLFNDVPTIDFDTEGRPDIPVYNPNENAPAPKVNYNPHYNPFDDTPQSTLQSKNNSRWEDLYAGLQSSEEPDLGLFPDTDKDEEGTVSRMIEDKSPAHYQYKGRYVMTAVKSGLLVIDQHRAHVRILFEQYLRQVAQRSGTSQKVLFPEVVQFTASEDLVAQKIMLDLQGLGFELTDLGARNYAVNAIPAGLEGINPIEMIRDMVATAMEKGAGLHDDVNQALALSLARNAAIPYGQVLGNDEMESLVNALFACQNVNYTPNGQKILAIMAQTDLEQLFG